MARETREAYVARKRVFNARRKLERERAQRQGKLTPDEAVALYRAEKAKAAPRLKAREAETMALVKKAIAKADAEQAPRPGRPRRLPPMHLTSNPANALLNAVNPWGFAE